MKKTHYDLPALLTISPVTSAGRCRMRLFLGFYITSQQLDWEINTLQYQKDGTILEIEVVASPIEQ